MSINFKILTFLWAGFILILSITPGNYIPPVKFELIAPDTIAHVVFYLVLVFLSLKWIKPNKFLTLILIFLICVLYGYVIEVVQGSLIPGRFYDLYDALSNSFGALVGLIIYKIIS